MIPITLNNIIKWTEGTILHNTQQEINAENFSITGISTDTRTIKQGELFIPLTGENYDGHDYIHQAIDNGAAAFLTSGKLPESFQRQIVIRVKDTLKAYQKIAHNYRKLFPVPIVAITGSNGKTTTKDIIAQVLKTKFNVLATEKNYNNEIGIPKTLLNLEHEHEVVVLEMAMRGLGQIQELAEIALPDIGLITNIGEAHFELLGSYEAIASAKAELLRYMNPNGTAVLNSDDRWIQYCRERAPKNIVTYGIDNPSDCKLIRLTNLGIEGYNLEVSFKEKISPFRLPLMGNYNLYNALAAVAVAGLLGMTPEEIGEGLKAVQPSERRLQIRTSTAKCKVIDDTYNASPSSMGKSLEILSSLKTQGKKYAILADMLELGDIAVEAHRNIGKTVKELHIDELHVMGELGKEIAQGAINAGMKPENIHYWNDKHKLVEYLKEKLTDNDLVLVKGSRRMQMEEIVEALVQSNTDILEKIAR